MNLQREIPMVAMVGTRTRLSVSQSWREGPYFRGSTIATIAKPDCKPHAEADGFAMNDRRAIEDHPRQEASARSRRHRIAGKEHRRTRALTSGCHHLA